jgi:phospholipid transport system substrate-binding protein
MRPVTSAALAFALLGAAAPVALAPAAALAQAGDPAAQVVQRFDDSLLATMKQGKALGFEGRYRRLEAPVRDTFDLPIMIQFAVGPSTWKTLSSSDQSALLTAFTRFSVSTWAKNFDSYDGEKFQVGQVDTKGPDKLVHTQLVPKSGAPTDLTYRMRQASGGRWKIIDVYFNGSISQLSQQRADFASSLQSGGAPALVKKINDLSDKQAHGG